MVDTMWAIEQFRTNQERQYIYVMPFLAEVQRVNNATKDYRGTHDGKA